MRFAVASNSVHPLFMALGIGRSDIELAAAMTAKDATAIEAAEKP
jgi:hypothetical protein